MTFEDNKVIKFPKISIVIPVFNAISTIALCLESVQELNYPREKLEIIVVDNGSDDGSDKIAKNLVYNFFMKHR